jgi:hypothetical protein
MYSFHGKIYEWILTKNGLGYILGDFFFSNSSGHPGGFPELGSTKEKLQNVHMCVLIDTVFLQAQ